MGPKVGLDPGSQHAGPGVCQAALAVAEIPDMIAMGVVEDDGGDLLGGDAGSFERGRPEAGVDKHDLITHAEEQDVIVHQQLLGGEIPEREGLCQLGGGASRPPMRNR